MFIQLDCHKVSVLFIIVIMLPVIYTTSAWIASISSWLSIASLSLFYLASFSQLHWDDILHILYGILRNLRVIPMFWKCTVTRREERRNEAGKLPDSFSGKVEAHWQNVSDELCVIGLGSVTCSSVTCKKLHGCQQYIVPRVLVLVTLTNTFQTVFCFSGIKQDRDIDILNSLQYL